MLLIALLGLIGAVLISSAFVKSPNSGAGLVLVTFAMETIFVVFPPLPLGLNVFPPDIVFVLLFSAAILRYLLGEVRLTRRRAVVIVMALLFMVALARGVSAFGLKEAGVQSRKLFYFYAGVLYFSSFNFTRQQQRKIIETWFHVAWLVVAIVIFRWFATGMGLEIAASWEDPSGASIMRVVNAGNAMFLCVALFFAISLISIRRSTLGQRALACVLPPMLILLQHRTVWVVLLFGLMWLFSRQTRVLRKVLVAVLVALVIVVPLIFFVFDSSYVMGVLVKSATDPSTLIWRVSGWRQLLADRKASPIDYVIGQPAGTDESRVINNTLVDANPHNFYVQTFLCQGVLGLVLLLWLYISQIRQFRKARSTATSRRAYLPLRTWALFLYAQMLFFMTYPPNYDQVLIVGIAVGISSSVFCIRTRKRVRTNLTTLSVNEGLA